MSRQVPGADATLGNRLLATFLDAVVALGLALAVQLLDVLPFIEIGDQLSWVVLGGYIISRDSLSFLQGQSVGKKAMNDSRRTEYKMLMMLSARSLVT